MEKNRKLNQKEKGITLIALIITIVLLIILATVAVRSIVGEDSLIKSTETAANDYNIASYQEQLEAKVRQIIQEQAIKGEEASLLTIAEALQEEGTWIANIEINLDQLDTNDDIVVITKEGYTFQIYYETTYGEIFLEYLGTVGNKTTDKIPRLIATYEGGNIICTLDTSSSTIENLTLIYQGKIVDSKTNPSEETTFKIESKNTGWYTVKTTSKENYIRYAWIRVSNITDKIPSPTIEITNNPKQGTGKWYVTSPTVTISVESLDTEQTIYYTLTGAMQQTETAILGNSQEIEISEPGLTRITAVTKENGKESKSQTLIIKYDDEETNKPTLNDLKLEATYGEIIENSEYRWILSEGTIEIEAEDQESGITAYQYEVTDIDGETIIKQETLVEDIGIPIKIQTDGEYVIRVKAIDKAGNQSDSKTINIHKDTEAPIVGTPAIYGAEETDNGIDVAIGIGCGDTLSGIAKQECYIVGQTGSIAESTNRNLHHRRIIRQHHLPNLHESL